jgi:uncharacterized phage-like protein YoqJ
MALGWDTAVALAAIRCGIPFTAAIPFEGQELRWPEESQRVYRYMRTQANGETVVAFGGYSARAMQARNEWMVDRCDAVVALWSGDVGGTANCVRYAGQVGRPVTNLWERWIFA